MTGQSMERIKAQQPMSSASEAWDTVFHPDPDPDLSPLFTDSHRHSAIDEHVAAREPTLFRSVLPSHHSDYQLALEFKLQRAQVLNVNRRLCTRRKLSRLRRNNLLVMEARRYARIAPATERPVKTKLVRSETGMSGDVGKPLRRQKLGWLDSKWITKILLLNWRLRCAFPNTSRKVRFLSTPLRSPYTTAIWNALNRDIQTESRVWGTLE